MTSSTRPLRSDAERNRRRILDAAREEFAARGPEACVDDIARAAGVGVGTIYRRFPAKEDLLTEVVRDRFELVLERIDAAAAAEEPWQAFVGALGALAELVGRDRALVEVVQTRPSVRDAVAAERRRVRASLRGILERAQAAGAVREDVVADDLLLLAGLAARLPAWRLERQPRLWQRYLSIVVDGLRPEGATPIEHPPPR